MPPSTAVATVIWSGEIVRRVPEFRVHQGCGYLFNVGTGYGAWSLASFGVWHFPTYLFLSYTKKDFPIGVSNETISAIQPSCFNWPIISLAFGSVAFLMRLGLISDCRYSNPPKFWVNGNTASGWEFGVIFF